jgi:ERCC4-related helicase
MQVRKKLAAMGSGSSDDPKRAKLTEILEQHFQTAAKTGVVDSRAMVFTSLKDGVADICSWLNALQSGTISSKCDLIPD